MNQQTAIEKLREDLHRGDTLYTLRLNQGSKTQRKHYAFLRATSKGTIENYTWLVALVNESPRHEIDGGVMTRGDDYDIVALLGIRLYDDYEAFSVRRLD